MLQLTTCSASAGPFLQWPVPSTSVLTVVKVAGGPPAADKPEGSIASARSTATNDASSRLIPFPTFSISPCLAYRDGMTSACSWRWPKKLRWCDAAPVGMRTRYAIARVHDGRWRVKKMTGTASSRVLKTDTLRSARRHAAFSRRHAQLAHYTCETWPDPND